MADINRIPLVTTPIAREGQQISPIWFRWMQYIDGRIATLPPAPEPPPPPVQANIQFQDDSVDVGTANPRYVSFDENLTATLDGDTVRVVSVPPPPTPTSPDLLEGTLNYAFAAMTSTIIDDGAGTTSISGAGGGTVTPGTTTWAGKLRRLTYAQNAVNQAWGLRGSAANAPLWIGTADHGGGFDVFVFCGTGAPFSSNAGFAVGVGSLVATPASGAFSTDPNFAFIGVTRDAGQSTYRLGIKPATTSATTVDTGIAVAPDQFFAVRVTVPSGASPDVEVSLAVFDSTTGAKTIFRNTFTSNYPTTGLTWAMCGWSSAGNDVLTFVRAFAVVPDDAFVGL